MGDCEVLGKPPYVVLHLACLIIIFAYFIQLFICVAVQLLLPVCGGCDKQKCPFISAEFSTYLTNV